MAIIDSLPLTPIEELMLHQDSTAYPYTCFIRLRFDGRLSQSPFETAARAALVRHPMLAATVQKNRRRPRWQLTTDPRPKIVWRDGAVGEEFPAAEYLDFAHGGLRLWVTRSENASDLLVQWHHACCDGLGIFQFLQDLLVLYAREQGESLPAKALPALEPERLRQRGRFGLNFSRLLRMVPRQAVGLAGVRQFLMRKPSPTVPHQQQPLDAATSRPYPAAWSHHFDDETSQALRSAAQEWKVTTNDLLTRDLFQALDTFRARRQVGDDEQWLRMLVPISLRNSQDRRLPAANVVSSVFLDRRGAILRQPQELLASVQDEMELIKSHRLGFTFVFSLHAHRWLPGGLRRAARNSCVASAVFTNLGKLLGRCALPRDDGRLVCGDVRLMDVAILAPLTPGTCTVFSAGWYARRLSVTLHYDPRPLSSDDARELLADFVDQVRRSAGARSAQPVLQ